MECTYRPFQGTPRLSLWAQSLSHSLTDLAAFGFLAYAGICCPQPIRCEPNRTESNWLCFALHIIRARVFRRRWETSWDLFLWEMGRQDAKICGQHAKSLRHVCNSCSSRAITGSGSGSTTQTRSDLKDCGWDCTLKRFIGLGHFVRSLIFYVPWINITRNPRYLSERIYFITSLNTKIKHTLLYVVIGFCVEFHVLQGWPKGR